MSFVDALYDRKRDLILVTERVDGERVLREYPPEHVLYYAHDGGQHKSIFGDTCRKFTTPHSRKFKAKLKEIEASGRKIFESDINPVFRSLATHYMGVDAPKLNVCFFDIEADFHPKRGYAPTDDPFNAVTAISFYLSAEDLLVCLALLPPTLTVEEGQEIVEGFENTVLFENEDDLLQTFLEMIQDADCLSSWNGEGFDIPYLTNRIKRRLGSAATKQFCLWGQEPREREFVKFGRTLKSYEYPGRPHLDYLLLYQKHNTQQQQSYRLDFIGEIEVGDHKVPYEGTLDDLYKKDFGRFIEYSRQDVALMVKIDKKRKFIELANQISHSNCVVMKTTMGSVALVEQAIINEFHNMGFIVPNRKPRPEISQEMIDNGEEEEKTPVVGAYVAQPKVGISQWIGCVDVNSLYPSAIRALNMSPETIVGQVLPDMTMALVAERIAKGTPRAEAWDGIFETLEVKAMHERADSMLNVLFEDGSSRSMSGDELYQYVFGHGSNLCISANGTIFRTDRDGMIPALLAKWYADRKTMQAKARDFETKSQSAKSPEDKAEALFWFGFWDQRQLALKILLNSVYGALLNEGLRFYDARIGQSTTLTGRSVDRHMAATLNETITGHYDYRGKSVYYCDTDSVYFSAYEVLKSDPDYKDFDWSVDNIISLYDSIADAANETFPGFMHSRFNTGLARGSIIKAGRELIASKALFIKKKKYCALMVEKEGTRLDVDGKPGKPKAMGLDLKRADTPKPMQKFLEKVMMEILTTNDTPRMYGYVREFRAEFIGTVPWQKGSPKKVSGLCAYAEAKEGRGPKAKPNGKVMVPGHVTASMHWNSLRTLHNDKHVMAITDGSRIVVCKLLPNALKMDSIAYPVDEPHLPQWFKELPFDDKLMEETIIDKKLLNLVGVLDWDMTQTRNRLNDDLFVFEDEAANVAVQASGWDGGDEDE